MAEPEVVTFKAPAPSPEVMSFRAPKPAAEEEPEVVAFTAPKIKTAFDFNKEVAPRKEINREQFKKDYGKYPEEFDQATPIKTTFAGALAKSAMSGNPASALVNLISHPEYSYVVGENLNGMYKAMQTSRLDGFVDNAIKTLLTPRPTPGILKEMGFNTLEEYTVHQDNVYKDNLMRGVTGFQKVAGATLGSIVSFGADTPLFRTAGLGAQAAKQSSAALTALSNSKWARLMKLSAGGAGTMAGYEALRQAADEGSINSPEEVLMWGGAGALGIPALDKLLRVGGAIASRTNQEAVLATIEKYTQKAMKGGKSPHAAYDEALARSGFTAEEIASVVDHTGRSVHWSKAVKPATAKDFESSFFGKAWDGLTSPLVSTTSAVKSALDTVFRPISGELHKRAPALFNYLNKNILEANRYHQSLLDRYVPIQYIGDALPKAERKVFWDALSNSRTFQVDEIVNKLPKAIKGADGKLYNPREVVNSVRKLWDDILETEKGAGIEVAYLADYWPHALKYGEYEKLTKTMGYEAKNEFQQMLKHAAENSPTKELSAGQMEDLMLSYIRGAVPKGFHKSTLTKPRKIDFITPDIAKHYEDPLQAGIRRIDRHAHAMQKRRLFGKHLQDSSIDATGEGSVMAFTQDLLSREEIYLKDMPKILDVMKAFAGYQPTGRKLQAAKNIFYMTTIGQPGSALTQFGDLAVGSFVNGFANSILGIFRSGGGRSVDPFREFGLRHVAQEIASTGKTAKWLDGTLKVTLFSQVDRLGKTHLVNSAWVKNERLVNSLRGTQQFRQKWTKYFGGETDDLIRDLQNKKLTDNVRLLLWNELTNAQPVSLLEVPQRYLEMKGGRVLYALSTFALKQIDLLRRTSIQEIKAGNVGKGLANLMRYTMYTTGGNTITEQAKNFIHGRDVDFTDVQFANMFKQLLVSEYLVGELTSGNKEADAIAKQVLAAPIGIADIGFSVATDLGKLADGTLSLKTSRSLEKVPVVGRILSNLFGAGLTRYRKKQEREFLESVGFDDEELDKYEADYNDY